MSLTTEEILRHHARPLEIVRVADLKAWDRNPRKYSPRAIAHTADQIRTYGFTTPLLVRLANRQILAGHRRLRAAEKLGLLSVPVLFVDVDERTGIEMALADNPKDNDKHGTWDDDVLGAVLRDLAGADLKLPDLGWTDAELRALVQGPATETPPPPMVPLLPTTAQSKTGEVYELGPHRLVCGDCTHEDTLALLLGDKRADMVFTDPPYAIYGSSTGIDSSVADDRCVRPFFEAALRAAVRGVRPFGSIYVCCDWRSWAAWWEAARPVKLTPANMLVWDKGSSGMGSNYANTHELIGYWLAKPSRTKMFQSKRGVRPVLKPNVVGRDLKAADGDDGPERAEVAGVDGLLRYGRVTGAARTHNAAKPIPLICELIDGSCLEGESVLDLFGGSGTALMAAAQKGRVAYTVEIDPVWCDVIRLRWGTYACAANLEPGAGAL